MSARRPALPDHAPFHHLFDDVGDALERAAELLAGKRGVGLVQDIRETLQRTPRTDRRTLRNLIALHRIFALDLVNVPGSEEEARFAAIDPASPVVEKICLLKEALDEALGAYAKDGAAALLAAAA